MTRKITAVFFLAVIFSFTGLVVYSFSMGEAREASSSTEKKEKNINWAAMYPFKENNEDKKAYSISNITTFIEKISPYIERNFGQYISGKLAGYQNIVEVAKKYEGLIGWNIASYNEYNGIVELSDGYLISFKSKIDVKGNAKDITDLTRYCNNMGIGLFYCNFPAKICMYEDMNISGKLDFINQNADALLAMLEESGVKYYDFRKLLHEDGKNHHESFYKTDHHWKAETGLWAAGQTLKILRDDWGFETDPEILNPERFDYVKYPEWFLGSAGRKLTLARTKPDDFTMIYPKFPTLLDYDIPSLEIHTSGDFSITYDMEAVNEKDYYNKSPYHAYSYGDQALIKIHNRLIDNGKRILLIHDSFSDVVISFLSMGVTNTDAIDLRHFTGSVRKYIEQTRPDVVILMYTSGTAGATWVTMRHNGMCDFR